MEHPVFISYARRTSREQATALHEALGGRDGLAFLDTEESEPGERFPPMLAEALLSSRLVVILASKEYFRRWYCLWELEAALGPFLALGPGASDPERAAALAPIVVALPTQGTRTASLELLPLPPALQSRVWPGADDTATLESLVRRQLALGPRPLRERLAAADEVGRRLESRLLEQTALPEPRNLANARVYPTGLPTSLGGSFVGRADDLWRIHYTLSVLQNRRGEGASGAALTGALHGAGGFGKTRLALEYLHRFGPSHYPGGLFWVTADVGAERLEEQFHGILRTLDPGVPDLKAFRETQRNASLEMLGALDAIAATRRVLFVVDNVPEPGPEEESRPLRTWCPAIGKVSLLATSRARLDLGTEGVYGLAVAALSPEAAVNLLTEGLGQAGLREPDWRQIAEWVGFLPLAIELLNRTLRVGAIEPAELLSRTLGPGPARELDRQRQLLRRHVPKGALRGVTEAFSLSYEKLSEVEQRAVRLIAQLAPDPIPLELLNALGPETASSEVKATLRARHFVTPVETGDVPMFGGMHRVLADYLRGLSPEGVTELQHVGRALAVLMTPSTEDEAGNSPLMLACLPHAESVLDRLLPTEVEGETAVTLGLYTGVFLLNRGWSARALSLNTRLVERAVELLGVEHGVTLVAKNNLAVALRAEGRFGEARELEEAVLAARLRVLGEEHPDTLASMINLAASLRAQGEFGKARELLERVLPLAQLNLGEEDPDTLKAMNNLARVLRDQGDYLRAHDLDVRVLEARRRVLGENHPETITSMDNLAGDLADRGDLNGAQELEERALEARRRVQGDAHPNTLWSMMNVASTLSDRGAYAKARALQEHVLRTRLQTLGDAHPATITTMSNLAHTLMAEGNHQEARALSERVMEATRRMLGAAHPDTFTSMSNLAGILQELGDLHRARSLEEQALEGRQRTLGEEHPRTLMSMNNLAGILHAQGDLEKARALLERVLEVRRRNLGENHPSTLTVMGNLAEALADQGHLKAATELQTRTLETSQRVRGTAHPATIGLMGNLANMVFKQGDLTGARRYLEQVLPDARRVMGESHPATLTVMDNLATVMRAQGSHARAKALERELSRLRSRGR